jgi:uncharacterized protein with PIN domain
MPFYASHAINVLGENNQPTGEVRCPKCNAAVKPLNQQERRKKYELNNAGLGLKAEN